MKSKLTASSEQFEPISGGTRRAAGPMVFFGDGSGCDSFSSTTGSRLALSSRSSVFRNGNTASQFHNRAGDSVDVHEFFAGIGLVRLALERQGWNVVFANDIDPEESGNVPAKLAER